MSHGSIERQQWLISKQCPEARMLPTVCQPMTKITKTLMTLKGRYFARKARRDNSNKEPSLDKWSQGHYGQLHGKYWRGFVRGKTPKFKFGYCGSSVFFYFVFGIGVRNSVNHGIFPVFRRLDAKLRRVLASCRMTIWAQKEDDNAPTEFLSLAQTCRRLTKGSPFTNRPYMLIVRLYYVRRLNDFANTITR